MKDVEKQKRLGKYREKRHEKYRKKLFSKFEKSEQEKVRKEMNLLLLLLDFPYLAYFVP